MQEAQRSRLRQNSQQGLQPASRNQQSISLVRIGKRLLKNPVELVFLIIAIAFIMSVGYRVSNHFSKDNQAIQRNPQMKMRRKLKQITKLSYSQPLQYFQTNSPLPNNNLHFFQNKPNFEEAPSEDGFRMWAIMKKQKASQIKKQTQADRGCAFINSLSLLKMQTISSLQALLNTKYIQIVLIVTRIKDQHAQDLIFSQVNPQVYSILNKKFHVDSDYQFLSKLMKSCTKVSYLFSNFIIDDKMATSMSQEMKKISTQQILYSAYYRSMEGRRVRLPTLLKVNLETVKDEDFNSYVFVFDTNLLSIITPVSFDYYAKYTLEQLILLPLLTIAQGSGMLLQTKQLIHGFNQKFFTKNQFFLKPIPDEGNKSLCFISYPSIPNIISFKQLNSYIQSLLHMQRQSAKISIVLNLPFNMTESSDLMLISQKIKEIKFKYNFVRIRLRIRYNKTVSTHAIHEAAYYYCPQNSIIVSSRHNAIFDQQFAQQVLSGVNEKTHYMLAGFRLQQSNKIDYEPQDLKTSIRKSNLFNDYFQHFQIFKSQFFKSMPPWSTKYEEIQFYQTQFPIVTYMLESTNAQFQYINKTLVTITKRTQTKQQEKQIANFQKYPSYPELQDNIFIPYKYSILQNQALRRFAPNKIQKIIHQIFFQKGSSKFVSILQNTIKAHNPGFKIMTWHMQNITIQNFPLTYQIFYRIFVQNKNNLKYQKLYAQILKMELMFRYGGIYLNYVTESKKSLAPFLKYQLLHFGCGNNILKNQGLVDWEGINGAYQNHHLLKVYLDEIIYQMSMKFLLEDKIQDVNVSQITGPYFSRQQYFNLIGFGCHLFNPYSTDNACEDQDIELASDQYAYMVTNDKGQQFKINLPCQEYPEAYIISYNFRPNFDQQPQKTQISKNL